MTPQEYFTWINGIICQWRLLLWCYFYHMVEMTH
jgi:hypothetical protein